MKTIFDLTYPQLVEWCELNNEKKYRAKQIYTWLYKKRVASFGAMSDVSKAFQDKLQTSFEFDNLTLKEKHVAQDETTKFLFECEDGMLIETVLMHHDYGKSVCVSSQIGCNMGCKFCASGLLKKQRDVTAGEMVQQILHVQRELDNQQERVSSVVVMGIGEPFDNYDHVLDFLKIVNNDHGLAIGSRKLTISTCGIIEGILKLADEPLQINLAISLHAPNDELRSQLMPINQAHPIKDLMNALKLYYKKTNRRITYEYILLKDVNDQPEHANQLADLIFGQNAYVNLIPYNPVLEQSFERTNIKSALKFYDQLKKRGIQTTLRQEHGLDINAACGQLRSKKVKEGAHESNR
jgi:23S rRNA (adenine2503-C2)-methyltransferase